MRLNNNQIEGMARVFDGLCVVAVVAFTSASFDYFLIKLYEYTMLFFVIPLTITIALMIRRYIK